MDDAAPRGHARDWKVNSIGFLRLLMAAMVLIGHVKEFSGLNTAWPFSLKGNFGFGETAVLGFFFLSGMLITRSWEGAKGAWSFLVRRVLRIFPGYWVCLLACGFALGPLSVWLVKQSLTGYPWFSGPDSAIGYLLRNFFLQMGQESIGPALDGHGFNYPLWTLLSEFGCYLLTAVAAMLVARNKRWLEVAGVLALGAYVALYSKLPIGLHLEKLGGFVVCTCLAPLLFRRDRRLWLLGLTVALLAVVFWMRAPYLFGHMGDQAHLPDRLPHIVAYLFGVLALYFEEYLPASWGLFAIFALIAAAGDHIPYMGWLYLPAFCGMVYIAAFLLPVKNIERRADFSYGVYVYGYPVQAIVPLLGGAAYGYYPYLLFCLAGIAPLAALSWFLIEKPSMSLRKRLGG